MPTTAELYKAAVERRRETVTTERLERFERERKWHEFIGRLVGELREAGAMHVEDGIDIQKEEKLLTCDGWNSQFVVRERNGQCWLDAGEKTRTMYLSDFDALRDKIIELAAEASPLEDS